MTPLFIVEMTKISLGGLWKTMGYKDSLMSLMMNMRVELG